MIGQEHVNWRAASQRITLSLWHGIRLNRAWAVAMILSIVMVEGNAAIELPRKLEMAERVTALNGGYFRS